jgi:UDP-N-acetylglucosamine 4,6-dehydratase
MPYVILGGTGTLGREIVRQLTAKRADAKITVFSRDEAKQQDMRKAFPKVRYILGDIRDKASVLKAMEGATTVFHVAALKHLDVIEDNVSEAIRTNITGTINAAEAAIEAKVPRFVFSSTDKAVDPANVYGHTKAIGERYLLRLNSIQDHTRFSVFRWANVVGFRGSVLHYFAQTLREKNEASITDAAMTRYWIRIEDAVKFMLGNYGHAPLGAPMIPPMKAASVVRLADSVARAVGAAGYTLNMVGVRAGEKIHEAISPGQTSDKAPQYEDHELDDLVRSVLEVSA